MATCLRLIRAVCFNFTLQKRFKSWSYAHGGGVTPLTSAHIGNFVDQAAENYPQVEAVVNNVQGVRKTYQQYVNDINAFACGLLSLKLCVGDRVGLWSPNCYEWLVAQHAISKAGLILVPLSPAYQAPELEYCMKKVGLKTIIIYDQFRTQNYHQILTKLMPEIEQTKKDTTVSNKNFPLFESIISMSNQDLPGSFKFTDIMQSGKEEHRKRLEQIQEEMTMDKAAYIMFTSGTTGKPKGVVLSHHNLVNTFVTLHYRLPEQYKGINFRSCTVVPLFHGIGCMLISLRNLIGGHTVVLTGPAYSPEIALKNIEQEKCTEFFAPATMYIDMLSHPNAAKTDFSSLLKMEMGGSLCPYPLLKRLTEEWKCDNILVGYGSTELAGGICSNETASPFEEKLNTCGRVYDYMEIKMIDLKGNLVPRGTPGEICARGYKVMKGYWDDEEKTREVMTPDGWYHTGDVGIMLENGCIQIVDRIKDMVIRGGENIYPKEIEDFLMTHPKIQEIHVIGVPDERMGEEVCAWVTLKAGQTLTHEEMTSFCKGQLSHFKIPRYLRIVDQFPKTISGKVQKHVMREQERNKVAPK